MVHTYIASLVQYGLNTGLIEACDKTYITNQLLETLGLYESKEAEAKEMPLEDILKANIEKLKQRYPEGFSENNSIHR